MSGFWDTPLDSILRNLRLDTLLFAGVNLDQCVLHTLADANFLGYDTILLEDCAATTNPDFCREATLLNIRQIFGFTITSTALLESLRAMMPTSSIAKRAAELQAFRIAPTDSNYFACLLDPLADGVSFTMVVEIFEPGGKTPPNSHSIAEEAFFVLAGTGKRIRRWRQPRHRPGRRAGAAARNRTCGGEHRSRESCIA